LYLVFDLVLVGLIIFIVLFYMVGRPLQRAEESIEQVGRLDLELPLERTGGPLLSRLQTALRAMTTALKREQAMTKKQFDDLQSAHRHLMQTQSELVSAERLATVGKLAAGVAHEIGNPLGGILGYLSLARTKASGPELLDYLSRIESELQRIDQIVRGLLDMGRPSKGVLVPIELGPLIETCVRLVTSGPDFASVAIKTDISPGVCPRGEPGPLSQILLNLLFNAAQSIHGPGSITIRGRRSDGVVLLEVEDSGSGIPPDIFPRLFEPFFTTKSTKRGTGLGLAISRRLAAQMGGDLAASNLEGGGARFTVTLPAA
jgi:signal transduction histidine kinase